MMNENFDLQKYLANGAEIIVKDAIKASLKNPKESLFLAKFAKHTRKASKIRQKYSEKGKNIPIDGPAGAITTRDYHAFITAYYGNGFNHSIEEPAPTITTSDRFGIVKSVFMANEYSGGGQISDLEAPCPAVLTTPKQKIVSAQYLMNPQYQSEGGSIDSPCFTLIARMDKMPPYLISTEKGLGIAIYEDDSPMTKKVKEFMAMYGIVDIKMRMLKISELKKIMGFPEDYVLIGTQAEPTGHRRASTTSTRTWLDG